jgi:N-acetylglucosaminyldiphosphoundecaprenol N-acetyl-beta-D-mannosaminyltransferase
MRRFYCQSVYTYIDGMSLVFLARVLGIPLKRCHRATSLDWFEDLLRLAERKSWRIYFLGGRPEVADEVRDYFCALFPGLKIRSHHGYDAFSPETTVYEEIKKFVPHIVMVGMGMPLQEQWILESLDRVQTNLILSCGGLMDYYMGAQRPAPRWLGQMGLEWLYRLLHEPRRLFFRYVIEPVTLIPLCFREWRGKKHYANEREV